MRRSLARCTLASVLLASSAFTGLSAVVDADAEPPPTGACQQVAKTGGDIRSIPYAQEMLNIERAWKQSRGRGVTVGVIDSGIDNTQPLLARPGKVLPGFDFLRDKPGARFDCISHGTPVGSIIAGDKLPGIGMHGVAPDAKLLPVRVSDQETTPQNGSSNGEAVNPTVFARAIKWAVDNGASVLNLSVVLTKDEPAVRDAVRYARGKGAVLVAAVGNAHNQNQDDGLKPGADPIPYPAAYPGVLGVGSINNQGVRADTSQIGSYVRISAPGDKVLSGTRSKGLLFYSGTSFATPFVSGAAALIRSAHPDLSAAEVVKRLLATANPAPGNQPSDEYGYGIVDPYRAVTEELTGANAIPTPSRVRTPTPDVAASRSAAAAQARAGSANNSVKSLAAIAVVAGILFGAIVLGSRRRFQPARVDTPRISHF